MTTLTRTLLLAGSLLGSLALATTASAATFTVTNTADSGAGSLRQAIADANGAAGVDTVSISATGTITLTSGEITITESVIVNGPGARSLTVSGNNTSRIFRLDSGSAKDVAINDLALANGNTPGNGGAILNEGGNLTLQRVRITGSNAGDSGGAVYNALFGGGNLLTVQDSEISGNSADSEGAIYFIGFQLRVINSTISGNTATDSVGAIGIQFGDAEIRNSTVTGNSANLVGGIQSQNSTLAMESSIFSANTDGTGTNDINRIAGGSASASNSLFTEDVVASGVLNGMNAGNLIAVNPLLGSLANNGGPTNSHLPLAGSPVVGAGANSTGQVNDQRGPGFPRAAGGAVDIGAVQQFSVPPEMQVPALAPVLLVFLSLLLGVVGVRRLR